MLIRRPSDKHVILGGGLTVRSAGGGAAFSPLDLAGLKFWHGYDDIASLNQISDCGTPVTADADPIGCAVGKGGTAYNATQATSTARPAYKTGIQNGRSGGLFDGTSDWLDFGNSGTPVIPATADWAIYGAFRSGNVGGVHLSQFLNLAGNGRLVITVSGGELILFLGNDSVSGEPSVSVSFGISINTTYVYSVRRESNVFTLRVNGADRNSRIDTGTRQILQTGNLYGGRTNSGTTYNDSPIVFLDGHLFEIAGQVATPSASDLTGMDTYLNGKYAAY